jgi:DNA-binding transcriptional LysR family regulator
MAALDLNLISLFVDIAEASSLSDAARRAGVTRSHVSQRLRILERHLGAQLMRRTTRRLELTEAGRTIYEHGLRIRQEAESAASAVGSSGRDARGLVRLSVPTGLGRLIIAPLLLSFQQDHKGIDLSVRFSNRVDDLVSAKIDVALKIASSPPDELVARELGQVRWCLCAAPGYLEGRPAIREAADLMAHGFVCPPTARRRLILQVGRATTVAVSPRVQSEDFCFLLDALEAGLGIGLLPHYMVAAALEEGRLLALLPGVHIGNAGEKLYLLTMQTLYPTPAQRVIVDFLRRKLAGLIGDPGAAEPLNLSL